MSVPYENILEDMIYDLYNNNREVLYNRGLSLLDGTMYRQVELGVYGRADLIIIGYLSDTINIQIIELKRDCINVQALYQMNSYTQAVINSMLKIADTYGMELTIPNIQTKDSKLNWILSCTFIGASVDDFTFLNTLSPNNNIEFYTYNFDAISGISFKIASQYRVKDDDKITQLDKILHNIIPPLDI